MIDYLTGALLHIPPMLRFALAMSIFLVIPALVAFVTINSAGNRLIDDPIVNSVIVLLVITSFPALFLLNCFLDGFLRHKETYKIKQEKGVFALSLKNIRRRESHIQPSGFFLTI